MSAPVVLVRFKARCRECSYLRGYAVTESELGRLDIAIIQWCACPVSQIVSPDVKEKE